MLGLLNKEFLGYDFLFLLFVFFSPFSASERRRVNLCVHSVAGNVDNSVFRDVTLLWNSCVANI